MRAVWAGLLLTSACATGTSADGTSGGKSNPADAFPATCDYRVGGATNDIVRDSLSFTFDGSTLHGTCSRYYSTNGSSGVKTLATLELKAYEGGKTYHVYQDATAGRFGFYGNDGFSYSTIFAGPSVVDAPQCNIQVLDGPDTAQAGSFVKLSLDCPRIYGYGASTADLRGAIVSDGLWQATVKAN